MNFLEMISAQGIFGFSFTYFYFLSSFSYTCFVTSYELTYSVNETSSAILYADNFFLSIYPFQYAYISFTACISLTLFSTNFIASSPLRYFCKITAALFYNYSYFYY